MFDVVYFSTFTFSCTDRYLLSYSSMVYYLSYLCAYKRIEVYDRW